MPLMGYYGNVRRWCTLAGAGHDERMTVGETARSGCAVMVIKIFPRSLIGATTLKGVCFRGKGTFELLMDRVDSHHCLAYSYPHLRKVYMQGGT